MKSKLLISLISIALSSFFTLGTHAQSVSSTPVGYVTLTINGNGYTALSNPLENAVVYSGTASSVSGSVITTSFSLTADEVSGSDLQGNSSHYVQTSDGTILDITANTTTGITVSASDLSGLVSDNDSIVIKKYSTIADLFGTDNSIGLTSGSNAATSDLVYIMSSDGAGIYTTLYYQTDLFGFLGGNGWRVVGDASSDASNIILAPDDGVLVYRAAAGNISLVVTGTVNTSPANRSLPQGYSLISYPFPTETTLSDSGIYVDGNGYVSGSSAANSDLVYVISPDGVFTTYYYQTDLFGFLGGNGWRVVGDASSDAGTTAIPVGSSLIIYHSGSGLDWSDAVPYTL
jgi:uncharacterized protein (TIGR02597 family)